jgi:hypothetical protein
MVTKASIRRRKFNLDGNSVAAWAGATVREYRFIAAEWPAWPLPDLDLNPPDDEPADVYTGPPTTSPTWPTRSTTAMSDVLSAAA